MGEQTSSLKTTLEQLHAELDKIESVDPEMRNLLESAVADIHEHLASAPKEESVAEEIQDQLAAAAGHFDQTHPTLSGLLRRTIDLLSNMGI